MILELRLRLAGAYNISEPAWSTHVVADDNLMKGQNQLSAEAAVNTVLERLKG